MNDLIFKEKLKKIKNMISFTISAIEAVANSCSYNDDYASEDTLRLVLNKQYDLSDEISNLLIDI